MALTSSVESLVILTHVSYIILYNPTENRSSLRQHFYRKEKYIKYWFPNYPFPKERLSPPCRLILLTTTKWSRRLWHPLPHGTGAPHHKAVASHSSSLHLHGALGCHSFLSHVPKGLFLPSLAAVDGQCSSEGPQWTSAVTVASLHQVFLGKVVSAWTNLQACIRRKVH